MGGTPQGPQGLQPPGQPAPMQPGDFETTVKNRDFYFAHEGIDPPMGMYITAEDAFLLGCLSNAGNTALRLNMRIYRAKRGVVQVQYDLAPGPGNTAVSIFRPEMEGILLSAGISAVAGFGAGTRPYVWLEVMRGGNSVNNASLTLIAGYASNNFPISWPTMEPKRGIDAAGTIGSFGPGAPAAGADWTFTASPLTRYQIVGLSALLTTSATAGTRTATLKITDGANTLALIDATATQAPSLAYQYTGLSGGFVGGIAGTHQYWPLSAPLIISSGYTIGTVTANLAATDQWSNVVLFGLMQAELV